VADSRWPIYLGEKIYVRMYATNVLDEKRLAGTRECAEGETPAASGANG